MESQKQHPRDVNQNKENTQNFTTISKNRDMLIQLGVLYGQRLKVGKMKAKYLDYHQRT